MFLVRELRQSLFPFLDRLTFSKYAVNSVPCREEGPYD